MFQEWRRPHLSSSPPPPNPEPTHFRVRLRAQKAAIVAASTNPTKAMYKSSHTCKRRLLLRTFSGIKQLFKKICRNLKSWKPQKNPGQRLIFPAILIAFCIMGALAGFLNGFILSYCRNILSILHFNDFVNISPSKSRVDR